MTLKARMEAPDMVALVSLAAKDLADTSCAAVKLVEGSEISQASECFGLLEPSCGSLPSTQDTRWVPFMLRLGWPKFCAASQPVYKGQFGGR